MTFHSPRSAWFWTIAALVGVGSLIGGKAMLAAGVSLHQHGPCPTSVDGVCIPNRAQWGYYQTQWRTWPGVAPQPAAVDAPPELPPGVSPFEAPSPEEEAIVVPPPPTSDAPAVELPGQAPADLPPGEGALPGQAFPPGELPEGMPQDQLPRAELPDPFQDDAVPGEQDQQDPVPDLPPELQELLRQPEGQQPFPDFGPPAGANPGGGLGAEKIESAAEANPLRTAAQPQRGTDIAANFKASSAAGWEASQPTRTEPALAAGHGNPLRRPSEGGTGVTVQQASHEQGVTLIAPSSKEPTPSPAARLNPLRAR
ncbi:MAG: hypothetical protein WDZ59_08595 [Pirellulales bacterium]